MNFFPLQKYFLGVGGKRGINKLVEQAKIHLNRTEVE